MCDTISNLAVSSLVLVRVGPMLELLRNTKITKGFSRS